MKIIFSQHYIRKGYIALISVLLMASLGLAIMVSVVSSGILASKTDLSLQQVGIARSMASACAEEALQRILETGTTSSKSSLTIASGTCDYTIYSQNGQNITINATGTLDTTISKIKVVIATTSPSIILSSWEEVADF